MAEQHRIARASGYSLVRTHTHDEFRSILLTNIESGFDVTGVNYKSGARASDECTRRRSDFDPTRAPMVTGPSSVPTRVDASGRISATDPRFGRPDEAEERLRGTLLPRLFSCAAERLRLRFPGLNRDLTLVLWRNPRGV